MKHIENKSHPNCMLCFLKLTIFQFTLNNFERAEANRRILSSDRPQHFFRSFVIFLVQH